jgi:hypothetical protein
MLRFPSNQRQSKLSAKWEASPKATPSVGFLDMPKEIRDMVYQEIGGKLRRKGVRWKATSPRKDGELETQKYERMNGHTCNHDESDPSKDNIAWKYTGRPNQHVGCTVMRTCRQLHAEFASVLYGSPLELYDIARGSNSIPISARYAGLVRTVFATATTALLQVDSLDAWRMQLQTANELSKVFVNANIVRLGWFVARPDPEAVTLLRQDPEMWARAVQEVVKTVKKVQTVKKVRKISYVLPSVPHNLEVVEMYWTNGWRREVQSILTPTSEAIGVMRAKKPTRTYADDGTLV